MRLGGPVFGEASDTARWITALQRHGYSAAYCPLDREADDSIIQAYADAAEDANILIAEVGAWSNPISPNEETRKRALAKCREMLTLADKIGARCCVNISGSRDSQWDGPHPDNLTEETFDLIVETVQTIIDSVKPNRTYYALETMPWAYPDSAENYLRLVKAINRRQFAVHFDPVNLICSPHRYYRNSEIIREFFEKLGPYIKSCHAKDTLMPKKLTVHIDEVRPGTGQLDYGTFLRELSKLDPDTPLMLEHLRTEEEYALAAGHIRTVAKELGLTLQ